MVEKSQKSDGPVKEPDPDRTLWDKVEAVLKNNPVIVIVGLSIIVLGGIKEVVEAAVTLTAFVEDRHDRQLEESTLESCSAIGSIRSGSALPDEHVELWFRSLEKPIRVYWIDREGKLAAPSYSVNGGQIAQITYPTHVWAIYDLNNNCVGVLRAGRKRVVLQMENDSLQITYPPEIKSTQTT